MNQNAGENQARLRALPAVDKLLEHARLADLISRHGRGLVTHHVQAQLGTLRAEILDGKNLPGNGLDTDAVAQMVVIRLAQEGEALPRVLNATGVILHSGLGRAPLSDAAVEALDRTRGYALLEVERTEGNRRSRDTRAGDLLRRLTGAEAALVVNNNAAATLLILATLGEGRGVICSRGEMVEIGGSYRIPDVMEASGAKLVSVGTTNKTHLWDYERAIDEDTAALLVVHTSNYRIVGFTSTPPLGEIAGLARARGLPLIHDLGSGSILSPEELGVGDEPPVSRSLTEGADVVCMSGDKLLGGPQAGIILGRKDLVGRMRRHPLARALRVDKMALAALEATLKLFLDKDGLPKHHRVTRMLTVSAAELRPRAEALAEALLERAPKGTHAAVVDSTAETGSGALPTLQIPSVAVAVSCGIPASRLARLFREATPGVFTRIKDERVCLDLRTLQPGEEVEAAQIVATTLQKAQGS